MCFTHTLLSVGDRLLKIVYVRDSRVKGYVTLGLIEKGEKITYTVSGAIYSSIGSPPPRTELGVEDAAVLEKEDECFRATRRALSILSYADNSERTLTQKLLRAGFSRGAALHAVEECLGHGYIDEKKQLLRIISTLANNRLKSERYIRMSLYGKGYRPNDVSAAIDELCEMGEVDFASVFERLCERLGVTDEEEKRKIAFKHGFRYRDY